ncbi:antitoxin of ParD toxin-antitoxin type II system and RHH [Rhizobium sp. RU35A]|nr:antitoxin of ParD toxin-antitoxin type II system and RHH [Rhizobium sp. RU35A]
MGRMVTVMISADLAAFVDGKVVAGDEACEAEAIAAALPLLRGHDDGLAAIRAAIEGGRSLRSVAPV